MREGYTSKGVVVLGSTGSVGQSALHIISDFPDKFRVVGLAANNSARELVEQARRFHPRAVALADEAAARWAADQLQPLGITVLAGPQGVAAVATLDEAEAVVAAIVGMSGLAGTYAATRAGKTIILANKETLVAAGPVIMAEARRAGAQILPADSEHNAIFQCLIGRSRSSVRKVWLTASGGPFLGWTRQELANVTPQQALRHPSWSMGPKITIDSATMMNKGLEIIEAMHLFDLDPDQVDVVIHPQSIVHGMVETNDGGFIAHLATPDMRLPLGYCLAYPEQLDRAYRPLSPLEMGQLDFLPPDRDNLPCLRLAEHAARTGGSLPAVMNAANEVAVEAFLAGRIQFIEISDLVEHIMGKHDVTPVTTLEEVIEVDRWARQQARQLLDSWDR